MDEGFRVRSKFSANQQEAGSEGSETVERIAGESGKMLAIQTRFDLC